MMARYLRSGGATALCLVFFTLLFSINIKSIFITYDEGLVVLGGARVLHGEVPYRDFWSMYSPGHFYLLAAAFRFLGENLMVARLVDSLIRILIVVVAFGILRQTTRIPLALLTSLVIAVILAAVRFYSYPIFPALLSIFLAFSFFLRWTRVFQRVPLIIAGVCVGVAALFRWDFALYATLGISGAAILSLLVRELNSMQSVCNPTSRGRLIAQASGAAVRGAVPFFGGLVPVIVLGYGVIVWLAGWKNLVEQLLIFPLTDFRSTRWLPYPTLNPYAEPDFSRWYQFYVPAILLSLSLIYETLRVVRRHRSDYSDSIATLGLALFGALLFNQALSRYDYVHALPSTLVGLLVIAISLHHIRHDRRDSFGLEVPPAVLATVIGLYLFPAIAPLRDALLRFPPTGCYSTLPRAGCIPSASYQEDVIKVVQSLTASEQPFFVGNTRHDAIWYNDPGLYFLAGRPPATRYHELHPGVATTRRVQEEIVREIDDQKIDVIALMHVELSTEPNMSGKSSGVALLDEYLRAHFEPVSTIGWYRVLRRRR